MHTFLIRKIRKSTTSAFRRTMSAFHPIADISCQPYVPDMRWGNIVPLLASLPLLLLSAQTIAFLAMKSRCSTDCATVTDLFRATITPVTVLALLVLVAVCYARGVKLSGWLLLTISVAARAAWPYQFIWLTGGV
jgi:hypothetical protein